MASVGESVSANKREGESQREFQEEAGKSKKKYSFIEVLWLYGAEENSR